MTRDPATAHADEEDRAAVACLPARVDHSLSDAEVRDQPGSAVVVSGFVVEGVVEFVGFEGAVAVRDGVAECDSSRLRDVLVVLRELKKR
ncbi:MAG: hypothetical protein JO164_06435 [Candidatus Eremiobacteraeota bacterium]|nr:hypothetical protein [Candidatus Eremiobacteraeota bacterium]